MYRIIGGDQKEYGPVSFDQLIAWVRDNRANAQTLVQKEGGAWVPMGSLPEFASALGGTASSLPPTPTPPGTGAPEPASFGSAPGAAPAGFPGSNPTPSEPSGPIPGYYGAPAGLGSRARDAVQGPATGLLVAGILGAITVIIGALFTLFGAANMAAAPQDMPPELQRLMDMAKQLQSPAMVIVDTVIKLAVSGLICFAAVKLRRLESFPLVVTAAILAIVPCTSPCCCVGIPIGIWVLVAIMKPEVKSAFQ